MTTPETHTVISVRGESQRTVAPDQASIYVTVLATGDTKRAASSDVARALAVVTTELAELGGESLTALTTRALLTWSTRSIQTWEEHSVDQTSGAKGRTGRHQASASLLINVRDFQLLGRVERIVSGNDR
ncbi:MAG: SIMPL domain-containing protein [Betaproteobacteria bacterium]